MSLRSYTQNRILARLAAQDREEGLQRRQAQQDAANRIAGLAALDRLVSAAGQIPGIISEQQAEADRKLLEEVGLAADVYGGEAVAGPTMPAGLPQPPAPLPPPAAPEPSMWDKMISSGSKSGPALRLEPPSWFDDLIRSGSGSNIRDVESGVPEPGEGGMPTDTSPADGGMVDPIAKQIAEESAAGLADVAAARQAAEARLTGGAPAPAEARPEPREIDTGAAMVSPAVVTRRGAARAAARKAAPAIPEVRLQSKFPTANKAHDRAMDLARQLARTEPFMARRLQAAAAALRAEPEITKNLENVEAAIADAERIPMETVQLRSMAPAEAAPQKTDEAPPATGATEMYREKVAAEAEARKPAPEKPVSAPVARYATTLDEELAKTVQLSPLMSVDAREAGNAIVDSILAGQPVEDNSIAGSIARFLGQRPSERAIRVARLAAARRVKERQAAERKSAYEEAVQRVRLAEQRGGATAGSRARSATSAADYAKYREMEQEGAVDAIIGRYGDKLMAAARIADPGERARAVSQILTIDAIPATELNTADEIRGRIIADMTEFGEDFLKARKTKTEKAKAEKKPLLDTVTVRELSRTKTLFENLEEATPTKNRQLNMVLRTVAASGKVGEAFATAVRQAFITNPEAAAADAAIKRNISEYVKNTSGLASTDKEFERIRESAPNETDPPDVYYRKLNDFLREIARYHNNLLSASEASGRDIGELTPLEYAGFNVLTGEPETGGAAKAMDAISNME